MDDADSCRRKMTNASALIGGLAGERVRWTEASKGFDSQTMRLVGDVLLATGFLSYSGPFNQDFRSLLLQNWKKEMVQNKIPFTEVRGGGVSKKKKKKKNWGCVKINGGMFEKLIKGGGI